jgi:DNA-binding NarL/FixJ family response regulator
MAIKVAIVEDSADVCVELEQIVAEAGDCTCVCTCRNLQTALRRIPALAPDVVVMDINLPDGSGIDGTERIKRLIPDTQVLIFTIYEDDEQIFRALEAGASGYLLKRTAPEELINAIREITQGGVPMTGQVARRIIQSFRKRAPSIDSIEPLTHREVEVLQHLAKGLVTKEIARDLRITTETVNSHLKNIYGKLHVRTRTEAVLKFLG